MTIALTTALAINSNEHKRVKLPNIIDIEASGFGSSSYPIEIGVVRSDGERYSRLIKPFDDWTHWDKNAELVHKISREELSTDGIHGVKVCLELNDFLKNATVYSDGWQVDSVWLNALYSRARVEKTFHISSLEMILSPHQLKNWHHTKDAVINNLNIKRHLASNDALIIQQTFALSETGSSAS